MSREHLPNRLMLAGVLILVTWVASACYKDAGENVQPTSNRVNLGDIMTTTPASPVVLFTSTPTTAPLATATKMLVPTTTPPGVTQGEPMTTAPTATSEAGPAVAEATNTPQLAPTFTPAISGETATATPAGPVIATPGMSDIQPSATTGPTLNPALHPTPTALPIEENPCIHVVKSGDTLYSIAQDAGVLLSDLVAANGSLLGGSENTPLQIGWQLTLPGCATATEAALTPEGTPVEETPAEPSGTQPAAGQTVTHVVQPGEHLYSIARQYGVDPQAIIDANHLANPNVLHPGDTLIIPPAQ
jgi:LysM repeat protein